MYEYHVFMPEQFGETLWGNLVDPEAKCLVQYAIGMSDPRCVFIIF